MSDLVTFLGERLDEDEAAARKHLGWMKFEAKPGDWTRLMCDPVLGPFGGQTGTRDIAVGLYVGAMSDPARVLREVEAKRKILAEYQQLLSDAESVGEPSRRPRLYGQYDGMERAVKLLAAIYSDHPGYQQDWA